MYRCGSSGRSNSHSHTSHDGTSSFTILFDLPNKPSKVDEQSTNDPNTYHSSSSSSCSSPVDCTLSLGTASTRQSSGHKSPRGSNTGPGSVSTNYWDVLSQPKQSPASSRATSYVDCGNDSLLARRCANCDTTSTPLWRNGPRGPKSLCNACGIRYKKEQRRAAATPPESYSPFQATPAAVPESQNRHGMGYGYSHDHPWAYPPPPSTSTSKTQHSIPLSSSSGRWTSDNQNVGEEAAAMPYLSWCLNVPPPRAEFLHH